MTVLDGYQVAWTGGKPSSNWNDGLKEEPFTILPTQYRTDSRYYQVMGLESKFGRNDDILWLQKRVLQHFFDHDSSSPTSRTSEFSCCAALPITVALSDTVTLLCSSVVYIGLDVDASKLIEYTAGIGHGEKTARPEVVQCVSERVNIRNTTCRCVVCYKKQRKNKKRTRDEAMKSVRQSRLGCPACQKVVCTDCWQEFQTAGHNMDLI